MDLNKQQLLQCIEEAVSAEKKDNERILDYLKECNQLGLQVLPVDVNKSEISCAFEGESGLRLGFSALVAGKPPFLEEIIAERQQHGDFKTFQDFCERIDPELLSEEFFSCCVEAGAFDSTGTSRARLFPGHEKIIQAIQKSKAERSSNQISLFEMLPSSARESLDNIPLPEADSWTDEDTIAHEKNAMGFSFTEYLLQSEEENASEHGVREPKQDQPPVSEMPASETPIEHPAEIQDSSQPDVQDTIAEDIPKHQDAMLSEPTEDIVALETPNVQSSEQPTLIIQLQTGKTTEDTLIRLRNLMKQSPGEVCVMLEFIDEQNTRKFVKTHTEYSVDISEEFIHSIEAITGERTTRVLKKD